MNKQDVIKITQGLVGQRFIIFDTETTGFHSTDEIIQIAIVNERGETVLKSYIKPEQPITNSEYHGITDDMVKDAPTFPEIYPKLVEAMSGLPWLAYNLEYDARMLSQVCDRHKLPEIIGAVDDMCIMLLYADYYGDWNEYRKNNRWQKLDAAIEHLGLKRSGTAHDAESDAKAALEVLKAMSTFAKNGDNAYTDANDKGHLPMD